jgi:hypothetical protein
MTDVQTIGDRAIHASDALREAVSELPERRAPGSRKYGWVAAMLVLVAIAGTLLTYGNRQSTPLGVGNAPNPGSPTAGTSTTPATTAAPPVMPPDVVPFEQATPEQQQRALVAVERLKAWRPGVHDVEVLGVGGNGAAEFVELAELAPMARDATELLVIESMGEPADPGEGVAHELMPTDPNWPLPTSYGLEPRSSHKPMGDGPAGVGHGTWEFLGRNVIFGQASSRAARVELQKNGQPVNVIRPLDTRGVDPDGLKYWAAFLGDADRLVCFDAGGTVIYESALGHGPS